jgi:hypothetical protein
MKAFIPIALSLVLLVSCSQNADTSTSKLAREISKSNSQITGQESPAVNKSEEIESLLDRDSPKLIKTASMRMEVKDLNGTTKTIQTMIAKHKAYFSGMNYENRYDMAQNIITVKIPAAMFDSVMNDISEKAVYLESKGINIQDVSEEYVDIEARLKSKKAVEERYLDILKNKAKSVEDVLAAENQLRLIREEIEAKQARLNVLSHQVLYSTLELTLYERIEIKNGPEPNKPSFFSELGSSLKGGWNMIQSLLLGIIYVWPIWLLFVLGIYLFKKIRKKKNH